MLLHLEWLRARLVGRSRAPGGALLRDSRRTIRSAGCCASGAFGASYDNSRAKLLGTVHRSRAAACDERRADVRGAERTRVSLLA
jgi:hypothetical protein